MNTASLNDKGEGRFALEGHLDFNTVPGILTQSVSKFAGHKAVSVDLAGVAKINSAGMALLLEWRARAQADNTSLQLSNLPESLQQIARVCDVESLLMD